MKSPRTLFALSATLGLSMLPMSAHAFRSPQRCADSEYISSRVLQRYSGRSMIPLREQLELDATCRGVSVERVYVRASAREGDAHIRLLVNGRPITRWQKIGTILPQMYVFELPERFNTLGEQVKTLDLEIRGKALVYRVSADLNSGEEGREQPGREGREQPGREQPGREQPVEGGGERIPVRPGRGGSERNPEHPSHTAHDSNSAQPGEGSSETTPAPEATPSESPRNR